MAQMKNFYLIGLTGNLATGKSTVRRMLEQMGAVGIDADKLAHMAMQRGSPAWSTIVDRFGPGILHFNGKIDRQKLGAQVFDNAAGLAQLEEILHPAVGELIKTYLRQVNSPVVVIEAVKLIEAKMHLWCDSVWIVTAATEVEVQRVMRDRHMKAEDARARLAAQGNQEDKLRLADVIIDNSHDLNTTQLQVQNAWKNVIRADKARDKSAWLLDLSPVQPRPAPDQILPLADIKEVTPPVVTPPPPPAAVEMPKTAEPPRAAPAEPPPAPERAPAEPTAQAATATPVQEPVTAQPEPAQVSPPPVETPQVDTPVQAPAQEPQAVEPPPDSPSQVSPPQVAPPPVVAPAEPELAESAPIDVRRARRSDLEILGVALGKLEQRPEPLLRDQVIQRFGKRGYRIAVGDGRVVALATWEAENLVAMMRDVWAESERMGPRALPPLFALVEQDAQALQCEVSLIILQAQTPAFLSDQIRACGYQPRETGGLHRLWREVVEERMQPGDTLWVKLLREDMVTKPV